MSITNVACITKDVNQSLAKPPMNLNNFLCKIGHWGPSQYKDVVLPV